VCVDLLDQEDMFSGDYTITVELLKDYVYIDLDVLPTILGVSNGDYECWDEESEEWVDCTGLEACEVKKVRWTAGPFEPGQEYKVWVPLEMDTCHVTPGDLQATVSFQRQPCGDSFSKTLTVAELCSLSAQPTVYSLVFPYAPNFTGGGAWWVGMALTNPGDSDIEVTLTFHEADGDTYTATVTVPAGGLWASLAEDISVTAADGDAAFGDERFWVEAESEDGPFYGFMMFGNGHEAQGYLAED